jgi:predicted amidophosphoribosyltransferase
MAEQKKKAEKTHLTCPYCEAEIAEASFPFCQACKVKVFYCPSCKKSMPRVSNKCPHCGAVIKVSV